MPGRNVSFFNRVPDRILYPSAGGLCLLISPTPPGFFSAGGSKFSYLSPWKAVRKMVSPKLITFAPFPGCPPGSKY
jgi:hypothetical protein